MINWKVRFRNKAFWLAFIPALLLLVQQICALFGVTIDIGGLSAQLVAIVETAFIILALWGVVNDPTTAGASDSLLAMTYERPKE
jgi:phi LC3 family holin